MDFIQITKENWELAILLKPKRSQRQFLRSDVALYSLAKCYLFPDKYVPYLIEHNGKPIGCFRFRNYGHGVNLVSFFIDRKFQGRGLGRKAVEHFIDWTKQHHPNAREIELWVGPENAVARSLYERLGFQYTGEKSSTGNLYMEFHY